MINELKDHLENGEGWAKIKTNIPGVFVVKVPGTKNRSSRLMVEINPVDKQGQPKKRKGLFVANFEMYLQFLEALQDDKVGQLVKTIDGVNPKESAKDSKVLEL
jgi:hypothetical protein